MACSGGGQDYRYGRTAKDTQTVSNSSLSYRSWRPTQKHSIPVVMNPRVERWVKTFNGSLRKNFDRWVKRLGHYGPMIEKVLKEEGAPPDLIYLSMIESGFNMHANSTASAVGPWQFIQSTGKMYGLEKEFFVDERKDIIQSTRAAARHLKDLYKIYGDWYLAFSAYNAGPGKTNSAVRRGGTKNYWTLTSPRSHLFRQETKDYVPKILAALHIVKNYKKYGYTDKSFGAPLAYDRVSVPDATDIQTIAKSTSSTPEHIAALNPNLNLGITPPGQKFPILIPKGAREEFLRKYSMIPASKRVTHLMYQTGYGETINSVAKKYHLNPASITRINKHHSATAQLRPSTKIKIPANKSTLLALSKGGYGQSYAGGGSKTSVAYYKIRRGDTLHRIAQRNRTTIANLSRWNGLNRHSRLTAGRTLKIYRTGGGYQRNSSGHLIAMANPFLSNPSGEIRMSGVRHIIHNDEQSLDEFIAPTVIAKTKVEDLPVPQLVASEDTDTVVEDTKTEPAMIKTVTGETIGEDLENPDAQTDSALAQLQSDEALSAPVVVKSQPLYHVVKRGETLSGISAKYKVRVSQLRQLNKLRSDNVRISQKLLIKNTSGQSSAIAQAPAPKPTKAVQGAAIYRVESGDTLSSIAKSQRVPVSRLVALNNIRGSKITVGQKLVLKSNSPDATTSPAVAVSQPTQVATTHGNSVYVVKPNDSISTIATRHRVRVSDIMAWNNLRSSNIQAGQKIKILKGSLAGNSGSGKGKVIVHKVRTGDTLWSLSRKYGVKISDIIRWNNLKDNQVRPNQQIKIIAGLQTKGNPLI